MSLTGGTFTFQAGASVSGTGLLQVAGAALNVAADASVQNLTLSTGTLSGAGALTVGGR